MKSRLFIATPFVDGASLRSVNLAGYEKTCGPARQFHLCLAMRGNVQPRARRDFQDQREGGREQA
jgi:hypothetical protein